MALPKDVTRLIENFQTHFSDYKKNTYNEARLRKLIILHEEDQSTARD
ncbi:MAG: hypothetical protein OEZ22_12750 [Spirochaetia bacterium]|nr:hypothetical protein [Spirochaetia bacterium]